MLPVIVRLAQETFLDGDTLIERELSRATILAHHIPHIILLRSSEKVRWIYTTRIITPMAYEKITHRPDTKLMG